MPNVKKHNIVVVAKFLSSSEFHNAQWRRRLLCCLGPKYLAPLILNISTFFLQMDVEFGCRSSVRPSQRRATALLLLHDNRQPRAGCFVRQSVNRMSPRGEKAA